MAPLTQGAVERVQKMGTLLVQARRTGRIARPVLNEQIEPISKRRQDGRGREKPGLVKALARAWFCRSNGVQMPPAAGVISHADRNIGSNDLH
ncbi:hypothetical protein D5047_23205 [Verminephrobacter eiseniae]|nr:hypothetical protein [Verminephrobacter eiseniae]